MLDFTLKSYRALVQSLIEEGYTIMPFSQYLTTTPTTKYVILRHDVDELAHNALKMAQLEHSMGIRSTYFFRIVKQSNVPDVIRQIAAMGHEIGYHYEDLSLTNGDFSKAITSFEKNLTYFRQYYPVQTICMHGSSTSKYDNRTLWQHYKMSDYGIIGEPYISIDFNNIFYLTDTGYAWDGGRFATRDIVDSPFKLRFHTTQEIVQCIQNNQFPNQAMILAHTLWTNNTLQWVALHLREYLRNNIKLLSKRNRWIAKIYSSLVKRHWKQ